MSKICNVTLKDFIPFKKYSQPADRAEFSVNCVIILISWFITDEEKRLHLKTLFSTFPPLNKAYNPFLRKVNNW